MNAGDEVMVTAGPHRGKTGVVEAHNNFPASGQVPVKFGHDFWPWGREGEHFVAHFYPRQLEPKKG